MRNYVVLLTGSGAGAIAVVRIAGPSTEAFLRTHFSRQPRRGQLDYGLLRDGTRTLDDVIVALADDGARADLNLHGGPWVVRSALELCERSGFVRLASFDDAASVPALAVDGADWVEREVLRALPIATTELAVRMLLAQPSAWRRLRQLAATDLQAFQDQLRLVAADKSAYWLLHPPSVALIGIPNAGKSTLANALYGQTRSIAADLPGTTRDWVADLADMDGLAVLLHDMPGFRVTRDAIEVEAIAVAEKRTRAVDLIILVLDGARLESAEQQALRAAYPQALCVLNKVDQLGLAAANLPALQTVATSEVGLGALRSAIAGHFDCANYDLTRPRCWSAAVRSVLTRLELEPDGWPQPNF